MVESFLHREMEVEIALINLIYSEEFKTFVFQGLDSNKAQAMWYSFFYEILKATVAWTD